MEPPSRILSWNVLRGSGAESVDVAEIVEEHGPDLVLLQEATDATIGLTDRVGGVCAFHLLPGRSHGLLAWSPARLPPVDVIPLPFKRPDDRRSAIVLRYPAGSVAAVHLSHDQFLSRRQAAHLAGTMDPSAMMAGDFNAVGPMRLPGFFDRGPRTWTHLAKGILPFRLDRVLSRNVEVRSPRALGRGRSDHRPILFDVVWPGTTAHGQSDGRRCEPNRAVG